MDKCINSPTHNYIYFDLKTLNMSSLKTASALNIINNRCDPDVQMLILDNDRMIERCYIISFYHAQLKDFTRIRLMDVLFEYETLDASKPVSATFVHDDESITINILTLLDQVVNHSEKVNRIIFRRDNLYELLIDFFKPSSIEDFEFDKVILKYATVFDALSSRKSMYISDQYTRLKSNHVILYKSETSFKKEGSRPIEYISKSVDVELQCMAIAPYIDVRALEIEKSLGYRQYVDLDSTTAMHCNDNMGWEIRFGNSMMSHTPDILKGSKIIIVLSSGLKFKGYKDKIVPSFLKEVTINDSVLIWKLKEDIKKESLTYSWIIDTSVKADCGVEDIEAYFIPINQPEFSFFPSKIKSSPEYVEANFIYEPIKSRLPRSFDLGKDCLHYVKSKNSIVITS